MPTWREIEKDHARLTSLRGPEETLWSELSRMLEEDGGCDFSIRSGTSERKRMDSFDSTPLHAKDDFVGGLFTEGMNPSERFFSYAIENKELQSWGPVAVWLTQFADATYQSLDPAIDNFYIEATPWLGDMATFGTGFIGQEENLSTGGFVVRSLALRESFKDVDADGNLCRFHRMYELTAEQTKQKWRDRAPKTNEGQTYKFLHAIYRNEEYQPGRLGPYGMQWKSCHASPDIAAFSIESGYHELPIHEIEWKRRSARAWGTGIGHKALADMNMLDEAQRSISTALQFEAEPMLLTQNENILTAADIHPHTVVSGSMTAEGKALVQTLQRGDNLQLPLSWVENVRNQIREAYKFSLIQLINRPQMTLGEFMGWKEEKLRQLAPHLVTVHRGLGSFIARRASLLMRQRRIPPPPPELGTTPIRVQFVSPFEQVQKAAKARNYLNVGTAAIQLAALWQNIGDNIESDTLMRGIADGLAGDPRVQRDPMKVEELRKQRAAAQAPDVQLERGAQQASIVADVAHARQAMTLSDQRGKAA